jgi:hypothetical protein
MPNGKPKIKRSKFKDYRTIFVESIYGGHRPDHFEIVIQSANIDASESQEEGKTVINIVDEICLKISPLQAKSILGWLSQHVKDFEAEFGEIKIGKKGKSITDETSKMYG